MTAGKSRREQLTDMGNARRLVRRHGRDLRYVRAWGWLVWDGRRWTRDETDEIERRAKDTARGILVEAEKAKTDEQCKTITNHAIASQRRQAITAMVGLAQSESEVRVRPVDFDADPWSLTVLNGTIDLRTGELRRHDRASLITKLAPVAYDPNAPAPRFRQFLDQVLGGDPDLVAFMQRAIGYSLTGSTREQCLFFLHGTGQNGKGALIRTLEALLGDHFRKADFSTFLERNSDNIREDVARLAGARFVAAEEAKDGRRFAEGIVKNLTGQDTIAARFLYQETFEFRPQFKLWLAANHKPHIIGTDPGIWRRFRLIPFAVHIDRPDHTLEPTLQGPELPGILRWAVEGCMAWQREGLSVPDSVREATEAYRVEQDVFGSFLDECVERVDGTEELAPAVRARYEAWCHEQSLPERDRLNANAFARSLTGRGIASRRDTQRRTWRTGIRLVRPDDTNSTLSTHSTSIPETFPFRARVSDFRENTSDTSKASNGSGHLFDGEAPGLSLSFPGLDDDEPDELSLTREALEGGA